MFGIVVDEAKKLLRMPGRWREVLRPRRWRQFLGILAFSARSGDRWKSMPGQPPLQQREYSTYAEYVRHQQSKFQHLDLAEYDANYRRRLNERLRDLPFVRSGATVLCLGARQGTEVKAFHDLGCFAVGLDLNPGAGNRWVLPGDFHDVQFPAASVDVIFTNSLDHAFDPAKMLGEISRLLKPGGVFILEASRGGAQNVSPDAYASFWWQRVEDLIALLARHGFEAGRRISFEQPWPGEQIYFSRK